MRKNVWALCILCVLYAQKGICGGKGPQTPDIRKVLQFFFQNHTTTPDGALKYQFEKHPDMWVVRAIDFERGAYTQNYFDTIWSVKKPVLKIVPAWAKPNNSETPDYNALIGGPNEVLMYTNSPAYGYDGWEEDAIRVLSADVKSLDDTLVYMLGRAYSEKAGSVYYDRDNPTGKSKLNEVEKKNTFLTNARLAIETYAQLKEKNPDFPTNAGRIGTKWANECVYAWFILQAFAQDAATAQTFIKGGIYDPFVLRATKKSLDVCAQNCVYLAYSDNDMWPMLYVQALQNYRRDIRMVAVSMLDVPEYITSLQRDLFQKDAIKMKMPAAFYKDGLPPYIGILKGQGSKTATINEMLDGLKAGKYKNPEYSLPVITENTFAYTDKAGKTMNKWTTQRPFVYTGDIALMDILQNSGKPIYFAGVDKQFIPIFPAAFVNEGFVHHFVEGADEQFDAEKINNMLQSMMAMAKPTPCGEHKLIANMVIHAMGFMIANESPETKLRPEFISALTQRFLTEAYFATPDKNLVDVADFCYKHKRKSIADDVVKFGLEHCDYYTKNLNFNPSEYLDAKKHQQDVATRLAEGKTKLLAVQQGAK